MSRYVAVTGAAGFLGTYVVEALAARGDYVYAVDAMTYAAKPRVLADLAERYAPRVHVRPVDVRTLTRLPDVDAVVHLAASTHVDNSLSEAAEFVENNVCCTAHMLELVRAKAQHGMPHYVHISTDEVYGSVEHGAADEHAPLRPSSPYSASKAAADMLVQAWATTYGVPAAILRPTNCFGNFQHEEKLIPKTIRNQLLGKPMTVHGAGEQVRQWLYAGDLAKAILRIIDERALDVFNVGGTSWVSVNSVISRIHESFGKDAVPATLGYERLGCDDRYAVSSERMLSLGWQATTKLWNELPNIVALERERFEANGL